MSRAATDWAWSLELKASQKLLMLSLADRADESHCCYPARIVDLLADGQPRGAVEIAQGLGVTYKQISTAISVLVKTGELKHRGAKGGRVYSLAKQVKRPTLRCKSENVIFQECRQSEAMKRVLMVWGRAPA